MSDSKFLHPMRVVCSGCDKHRNYCVCDAPVSCCRLCKKEFTKYRTITVSGLCVFCDG